MASLAYTEYLNSTWWRYIRRGVIFRDRGRCRRCGSREQLDVHHLDYSRLGREKFDDLITLCRACHQAEHRKNHG